MKKTGNKFILSESSLGLILLLFFAFILIFNDLWLPGLPSYDDCAKAERGWEMLQSGDFVTPRLAGKENFDHPPFYLWTIALSFKIFGKTEFAARFPGALMAFFSVWAAFALGRQAKNKNTGWWTAFFLTTSYMFLKLSRRVQTDIPFLLFTCLALLYFIRALKAAEEKDSSKNQYSYFILWGLFTGISGLIKSVFVIFPLFAPLLFLVFAGRGTRKKVFIPYLAGSAIAAIAAGWWYLYELIKLKGFFISSFIDSFVGGHVSGMSNLGRFGFTGYLYEFLRHFWLWLPLTLWAFYTIFRKRLLRKNTFLAVLLIHILFPLIVLSIFGDKTIRYVMFLFPPLLTLTAFVVDRQIDRKTIRKLSIIAIFFLLIVSSYILIRPVELSGRPNYDYCLLRDAINSGKLSPRDAEFHHYGEDYGINQLPLLFYTGINMKGVIYNEAELGALMLSGKKLFLVVRKDRVTEYIRANFNTAAVLEKRLVMKPNNNKAPVTAGKMEN
jgi:4-amino-4-deoxy-L-arabinose transferase-like glycosyltransferase